MFNGSNMPYKKIGGKDRARIPEDRKKNALPMAAMRKGMTVFIEIEAMYSNPPTAAATFAIVSMLNRNGELK